MAITIGLLKIKYKNHNYQSKNLIKFSIIKSVSINLLILYILLLFSISYLNSNTSF